jgi:hypothetical protein
MLHNLYKLLNFGESGYMELLTSTYVDNFINGLNLNEECGRLARVLLQTEDCCKTFYIGFLNRNRYVIDDLYDYREEKLINSQITIDTFIEKCYNSNMRETFENVFLQPFDLMEIAFIDNAIAEGRTSLEIIYSEFERNPNKNIFQIVL